MPGTSPLHNYVLTLFREAFGQPDHTLGDDEHWKLQPCSNAASINLLVDGSTERPAVWVFDPHDHNDGVFKSSIAGEQQVQDIIKMIQERIQRAVSDRRA